VNQDAAQQAPGGATGPRTPPDPHPDTPRPATEATGASQPLRGGAAVAAMRARLLGLVDDALACLLGHQLGGSDAAPVPDRLRALAFTARRLAEKLDGMPLPPVPRPPLEPPAERIEP